MRNKVVILVLGVLLSCGGLALAAPVTIQITGNITSAGGSALPSTIYEGVNFFGTYTYESSTIGIGGHHIYNSPYGISVSLGGYEFKTAPNHVGQFDMWIINDGVGPVWATDYYSVRSQYQNISIPSVGFNIDYVTWNLRDSSTTHDALSSDALPVTAPVLTDWNYNVLGIFGSGPSGSGLDITIEGTVTQAVLIPEPLTGILMTMGMLFLRRKR